MSYLYRHIRHDTDEPFYVGIGTDEKKYKRAHGTSPRNRFWKSITSKTSYDVEIMDDNLTNEEAFEKEKYFINLYGRRDLKTGTLCNLTKGGELVNGLSKETIKKRSETMKRLHAEGKIIVSEEARKRQSENMKLKYKNGEIINPNKGRIYTAEERVYLGTLMKGKKHSEETKKQISETLRRKIDIGEIIPHATGKKLTDEHKKKISMAGIGRIDSPETKQRRSIAAKNRAHSKEQWIVKH